MDRRLALPAAAAGAVLALAGCGGSSDKAESTVTTAAATHTAAPSTTDTAPEGTTTGTTPAPAPEPERATIAIRVVGGKPDGGIARPKVQEGEKVLLVVRSDTADEIHLHGYDISREVAAGGTARIAFVASIPGRFEVELEDSGVQLAELTVQE